MPQAVAAAIDYIATAVSAAAANAAAGAGLSITAVAVISTATYYAVDLTLYVGLSVLGASAVPNPEAGALTLKQPNPHRRFAYGRCRLAGSGFALWTANGNWAGQVFPVCEGPADGFERYYLFDKEVWLDGSGFVVPPGDGTYPSGFVQIFPRAGLFTETAYSDVISRFPDEWTSSHRGDGIASMAVISGHGNEKDFPSRYPGGEPQASTVGRWTVVYDPRDDSQDPADPSTWLWSDNPALCLLHFEMVHERRTFTDAIDGDGKAILVWKPSGWARFFAVTIGMWKAAADICDEPVNVANNTGQLTADVAIGAAAVVLDDVNGLAIGSSLSLGVDVGVVSGIAGLTVTFSPVTTAKHLKGDTAGWAVDGGSPVTVKRYTCGGFYEANNTADSVRQALLDSFDGWTSQSGDGALTIYAGKLYAPTIALTDDDILGYECQRFVEDESAVNSVVASYTEPATGYTTAECLPWQNAGDIFATGRERSENFDLKWVQNNSQARRLAKRRLATVNPAAQGTLRCDMTDNALAALGQRYVQIQCSDSPTMEDLFVELLGPAEIDLMGMTVTFKWVAADPNLDAWNFTVDEGALPFSASRSGGGQTPAPSGVVATAEFEGVSTGGQGVRIKVDFDDPGRDDLSFTIRWKRSTDASYNYEAFTTANDLGGTFEILTGFVPIDATIDVGLQFTSGGGRPGDYSTDVAVDTSSSAVAPSAPIGFSAANGSGHSLTGWTNPSSSNLSYLQVFRGTTTSFGSAVAVSGHLTPTGLSAPQTWDNTGLAAATYQFWVVAYNASGAASIATGPDAAVVT